MTSEKEKAFVAALPKAELHLHLEGSIEPATAVELAARHGVRITEEEVAARYSYRDFHGFLEAFKWVTSFLRTPADYALITERLAEKLLAQNILHAEVTISAGVMLWRKQDAAANLLAIHESGLAAGKSGLRMQWIPDATRQFGVAAAMEVARLTVEAKSIGAVAFGMGGDELSVPAEEFRGVYECAAAEGLHRVVHAGEIGGPEEVRAAVEILGAERIGHGIAVMHDPVVAESLRIFGTCLEICPTSNLRTGALARQLGQTNVTLDDHPVWKFWEQGLIFTIATDDPAMFGTSLNQEYGLFLARGLSLEHITALAMRSAMLSFLPQTEKFGLARRIQKTAESMGLV